MRTEAVSKKHDGALTAKFQNLIRRICELQREGERVKLQELLAIYELETTIDWKKIPSNRGLSFADVLRRDCSIHSIDHYERFKLAVTSYGAQAVLELGLAAAIECADLLLDNKGAAASKVKALAAKSGHEILVWRVEHAGRNPSPTTSRTIVRRQAEAVGLLVPKPERMTKKHDCKFKRAIAKVLAAKTLAEAQAAARV